MISGNETRKVRSLQTITRGSEGGSGGGCGSGGREGEAACRISVEIGRVNIELILGL